MADSIRPIDLPPAGAFSGTDVLIVDQGAGGVRKVLGSQVTSFLGLGTASKKDAGFFSLAETWTENLINLEVPDYVDVIQTNGYAEPGDSGGATFRRVDVNPGHPGSYQSADGAWWEMVFTGEVFVNMFGASASEDPDVNTLAVQNAIDFVAEMGGGIIRYGAGTYEQGPVYITADGVHIAGRGRGATIVKLKDSPLENQSGLFTFGRTSASGSTVEIDDNSIVDMTIDGNKANQHRGSDVSDGINSGILAYYVRRFRASRLIVYDCDGYGLGLQGTGGPNRSDFLLQDIETYGNDYDGIDFKGGETNRPLRVNIERVLSYDNGGGNIPGRAANGINIRGQYISLRDVYTWSNEVAGVSGVPGADGLYQVDMDNVWAIANVGNGILVEAVGVDADGDPSFATLTGCKALSNGSAGISVRGPSRLIGCVSRYNLQGLNDNSTAPVIEAHGCSFDRNTQDGVNLATGAVFKMFGGTANYNGRRGVNFLGEELHMLGAEAKNNGQTTTGAGVLLNGTNGAIKWALTDCSLNDDQVEPTQDRAVQFSDSPGAGNMLGCDLTGSVENAIQGTIPDGTRIEHCKGYMTQAKGSAQITSGNTSVVVAHGLAATPSPGDILLTVASAWGSAAKCWVSDVTSTNFKINVDADPAATVSFNWWAKVKGAA